MGRNPNFVSYSINQSDILIGKKVMTIAQQLKVTKFPFSIKDDTGKEIYYEERHGFWRKYEYDNNRNIIYHESSDGYWWKKEFDDKGNVIYFENSNGRIVDSRLKPVPEYTMEEVFF